MKAVWKVTAVVATVILIGLMVTPEERHPMASPTAAAAVALKSGVFPAQVQFQQGKHLDQDGDGMGEYGFLSELAGRRLVNGVRLSYLVGPMTTGDTSNHYRFAIWLPDGVGGALGEPYSQRPRSARPKAAKDQARHFRAYAWPDGTDESHRMFCLDNTGVVRNAPWTGVAPGWDAVTGGTGWEGEPVWKDTW